jgi:uncharacterized protein (TIGR02646 family)
MIRVEFDPDKLEGEAREWWDKWAARATLRTREYAEKLAKGEACEFDSSVWSDLKAWLVKNVFQGKCAYCENKISGSFFGAAEHFRPKGNVTVRADKGKKKATLGDGSEHGGYFWLAYDWHNLVPACDKCNNAKSDQFPVAASHVGNPAPETEELNELEQPFLLYPYRDEPSDYLRFGKGGVVCAIDDNERGAKTIETLDLNRQELMEERWDAQCRALEGLEVATGGLLTEEEARSERFAQYMGPRARFSMAVLDWYLERSRIVAERATKLALEAARRRRP